MQWRDALGRLKQSYLSESGRPVEWWHTDPKERTKTAYFGCAYCGHPISDEQRLNAHFRCIQTDQSAIEFIESLPPGLPERNWKVGTQGCQLSLQSAICANSQNGCPNLKDYQETARDAGKGLWIYCSITSFGAGLVCLREGKN